MPAGRRGRPAAEQRMFGNMAHLASLLRNAGALREGMSAMQARLATARYAAEAAGGQVRATVDGRGHLVDLRIDPALVRDGDVELLGETIVAAVREAAARSREAIRAELRQVTAGLEIPGLSDLLGAGP